jgi:c-di-GMP-binding flagellar brake protein YcgR
MSENEANCRRKYTRIKLSVPVEIETDMGDCPIRGATADLSLSGCYIETIFPFPIGTDMGLQLSLETTVLAAATVITCDPQVGNGIRFLKMLPEDRKALAAFLDTAQQTQDSGSQAVGANASAS